MGKSSRKPTVEVSPAAVSVPPSKSTKKGKRDAEVVLEKPASSKKPKKEIAEVKTKQKGDKKSKKVPPPKKKIETSTSEDTSSDSEEVTIPPKKEYAQKAVTGKKDLPEQKNGVGPESSSETSESDSDDEEVPEKKSIVKKSATKATVSVLNKKKDSSESSESEDEAPKVSAATKKVPVPIKVALTTHKKKHVSSDTSESDSDSENEAPSATILKKPEATKKEATLLIASKPNLKTVKKESSSDEDEDDSKDSSDEEPPSKAQQKKEATVFNASKPYVKTAKKESSSDEDESDSDESSDEEPPLKPQQKKESIVLNANKTNIKTAKKESSSDEDEDDSEKSSDEEPHSKAQSKKPTNQPTKSNSFESSEEDSSDESEDEKPIKSPAKMITDVKMKDAFAGQAPKKFDKNVEKTHVANQSAASGPKTLFVGNLPYDVVVDDVFEFFSEAGEVTDVRLAKREDGEFRGFGHVEFSTAEAAQKALNDLNGQELSGRAVNLDFARERERGSYTPNTGSYQKGQKGQTHTIFIKGFDTSLEMNQIESSIQEFFGSCGEITRISLPRDFETGSSKGIGYLDFNDSDSFSKALDLSGSELGGYTIMVEEAKPKFDNRDGGFSGGRGGREGGWSGGRSGGRRGGRDGGGWRGRGGDRGRGGRGNRGRSGFGTASQGKKTTFGDD